jgi:hypothetical protein
MRVGCAVLRRRFGLVLSGVGCVKTGLGACSRVEFLATGVGSVYRRVSCVQASVRWVGWV